MSNLFKPPARDQVTIFRRDPDELLGTFSNHAVLLEAEMFPTVEHYIQAMQFEDASLQAKIRSAASPEDAVKLGEPGFFKRLLQTRRDNWSELRSVYMTRAMYTKCKAFDEVAEKLLATGDQHLLETSQYDYYWGCGRDLRGENMYGQILMNIRDKLRSEAE